MKPRLIRRLILGLLVLLNGVLAVSLLVLQKEPSTVSSQQLDRVKLMYLQSGYEIVEMDMQIPQRQLKLELQDLEDRGDSFFEETAEKSYMIGSKVEYRSGKEILTVDRSDASMAYIREDKAPEAAAEKKEDREAAERMAERLLGTDEFQLIYTKEQYNGSRTFMFAERYKDHLILCNQAVIRVKGGQVRDAIVKQYRILGYAGQKSYYPLDEALYGCLSVYKKEQVEAQTELSVLDLFCGYGMAAEEDGQLYASPLILLIDDTGRMTEADLCTMKVRGLQY